MSGQVTRPCKGCYFLTFEFKKSQNFNFRLNKSKFEILNLEFQFISKWQEHDGWFNKQTRKQLEISGSLIQTFKIITQTFEIYPENLKKMLNQIFGLFNISGYQRVQISDKEGKRERTGHDVYISHLYSDINSTGRAETASMVTPRSSFVIRVNIYTSSSLTFKQKCISYNI